MHSRMKRILPIVGLLVLAFVLFGTAAPTFSSTAKLFGPGTMKGTATCVNRPGPGGPYRVDVSVTNAPPAQTVNVSINGSNAGWFMTDSNGKGTLKINKVSSPLGAGGAGDVINVGSLTGVFYDAAIAEQQTYELRGTVTNGVGVKYVVRYREFREFGQLERRWEVTITNAEPNQSIPTFVRSAFIRPLLPGDDGKATLRMRTASFINEGNNAAGWINLPNSFPSLRPGEVVQVGTSYITLHPV